MNKITKSIVIFSALFIVHGIKADTMYNLPLDDNGWSMITPTESTQVYYISNTSGNNETARAYSIDDNMINGDPFNPAGEIKPYSSINAVWNEIRNGEHGLIKRNDWILYKRGEVWIGQPGRINNFAGLDRENPMVLSSYGDSSLPRPKFYLTDLGIQLVGGSGNLQQDNNWFISSIHFIKYKKDGGISSLPALEGWTFEDIFFDQVSVDLQGFDGPKKNYVFRRNVMYGTYPNDTNHKQCIFAENIDSLLIEENFFDHCGTDPLTGYLSNKKWTGDKIYQEFDKVYHENNYFQTVTTHTSSVENEPGLGIDWSNKWIIFNYRDDATIFNHNLYLQYNNKNVVSRNNIISRASASGLMQRSGGEIYSNLFIDNPIHIVSGTVQPGSEGYRPFPSRIYNNTINGSIDINRNLPRGFAIISEHSNNNDIRNNIIANYNKDRGSAYGITVVNCYGNLTINNNTILNWEPTSTEFDSVGISVIEPNCKNEHIAITNNNHISSNDRSTPLKVHTDNIYMNSEMNYHTNSKYNEHGWSLIEQIEYKNNISNELIIDFIKHVIPKCNDRNTQQAIKECFYQERRLMHKANWNEKLTANYFEEWIN